MRCHKLLGDETHRRTLPMMPQAQTGKTEASESTEDDENVVLYVSSDSSDRTMTFKIRASQSLDTLMRVFCQRQGLEVSRTVLPVVQIKMRFLTCLRAWHV